MTEILADLLVDAAQRSPRAIALRAAGGSGAMDYSILRDSVARHAAFLQSLGIKAGDRIAVYLPKCSEAVISYFAVGLIGAVFVPVNPLLKRRQLMHILAHSGAKGLITHSPRLRAVGKELAGLDDLLWCLLTDGQDAVGTLESLTRVPCQAWAEAEHPPQPTSRASTDDLAALFYTSGSTGLPKGVMLSHANMLAGARSVTQYLHMRETDRVLALLPFSFDYGFSQLTTAFQVGASVCLFDYLLAKDVVRRLQAEQITLLAATPTLWQQLAALNWPESVRSTLRLICNSGGRLPAATSRQLQQHLPHTDVILMYGLTEAFRSTWVPPDALETHRDSIGIAIPGVELMVVDEHGQACEDGVEGELVHGGPLVALGYWHNPQATQHCFREWPNGGADKEQQQSDASRRAVWSGDRVRREPDGFLTFIGRDDAMIKSSGYRISPEEVEAVLLEQPQIQQAAVFPLPHPLLGEAVAACVVAEVMAEVMEGGSNPDRDGLLKALRQQLPNFMQPQMLEYVDELPLSANHKLDRKALARHYQYHFINHDSPHA